VNINFFVLQAAGFEVLSWGGRLPEHRVRRMLLQVKEAYVPSDWR